MVGRGNVQLVRDWFQCELLIQYGVFEFSRAFPKMITRLLHSFRVIDTH